MKNMDELVKNRGYHLTCFLIYNAIGVFSMYYAVWLYSGYVFMLLSVIAASFSKNKAAGILGITGVITSLHIPLTFFAYTGYYYYYYAGLSFSYLSSIMIALYIGMFAFSYKLYKLTDEKVEIKGEEVESEKVKSEEVENVVVNVEAKPLFCGSCGTKLSEDSRFCITCGHEIRQIVSVISH